jgi:hypothetical protein
MEGTIELGNGLAAGSEMPAKRPVGVVITGIIQILGSLLVLLFSALMLFAPAISGKSPGSTPPVPTGVFYGLAAFYGLFAVLGLLTAIGLFRLKNWARYSTLIFSPIPILIGLGFVLIVIILPFAQGHAAEAGDAALMTAMRTSAVIGLCIAGIGGFWLYYFNRRSVKLAFEQAAAEVGSSPGVMIDGGRIPVSIVVIAILMLFGCLGFIPGLFLHSPALIFGFVFKGAAAKAYFILFGMLQLYIGVALLRLDNRGRKVGIALQIVTIINGTIFLLVSTSRLSALTADFPGWGGGQPPTGHELDPNWMIMALRGGFGFGVVYAAVVLYCLVTRGWAFRDGAAAEAVAGGQ